MLESSAKKVPPASSAPAAPDAPAAATATPAAESPGKTPAMRVGVSPSPAKVRKEKFGSKSEQLNFLSLLFCCFLYPISSFL